MRNVYKESIYVTANADMHLDRVAFLSGVEINCRFQTAVHFLLSNMERERNSRDVLLNNEENQTSSQLRVGQLCTNNADARGHTYILELFKDFDRYAWGHACLASVCRSMTLATLINDRLRTITGPLHLLQVPDGCSFSSFEYGARKKFQGCATKQRGESNILPVKSRTDEKRYIRAFLFSLVSSQLCTNNADARGHTYILELFKDFDRYAWGHACLASVCRSMTLATLINDRLRTITGPLHLLQVPDGCSFSSFEYGARKKFQGCATKQRGESNILPVKSRTDEKRYIRAFLFSLVSSQLCTNNADARGHTYILELFKDFDRYAWGHACLASVCRSMTLATLINDRLRTITGPLHLLQVPDGCSFSSFEYGARKKFQGCATKQRGESNILPVKSRTDEKRYIRAFLFSLVSSQLCTNNADARGHTYILELFKDFDRYAWGHACLASVCRSMTLATLINDRLRTITGPLHLLQVPDGCSFSSFEYGARKKFQGCATKQRGESNILPVKSRTDEKRYIRAFLFSLVSSQLCTNNADARGHTYILELFKDFDRYAWGHACLASVCRSMTLATLINDRLRTITGPLHLLQVPDGCSFSSFEYGARKKFQGCATKQRGESNILPVKSRTDEKRYIRAFLFSLVSSQLCTNNADARGHTYILELFKDFDRKYSSNTASRFYSSVPPTYLNVLGSRRLFIFFFRIWSEKEIPGILNNEENQTSSQLRVGQDHSTLLSLGSPVQSYVPGKFSLLIVVASNWRPHQEDVEFSSGRSEGDLQMQGTCEESIE
ncbi:hypothetical protein MRB53_016343 [Persea americana]|uniref:Uncharacterized protein n=1 Tax=Persea americana TaxID=3435 RepID=A0ACC2M239_PERAE|nr:hypothetical protein MRB53_016343 [Persea americana]